MLEQFPLFQGLSLYIPAFATVAALAVIEVMVPGADFSLIVRNALAYDRKRALFTALGVVVSMLIHCSYAVLGIGEFLIDNPLIMNGIRYAGCIYLCALGAQLLYKGSVRVDSKLANKHNVASDNQDMSYGRAFRLGFFSNLLNAMAIVYLTSIYTSVLQPDMPKGILLMLILESPLIGLLWFSLVAMLFTYGGIKRVMSRYQPYVDRVVGIALLLISYKIAFLMV